MQWARKRGAIVAPGLAAAALVAGCGSGSGGSSPVAGGSGASQVAVTPSSTAAHASASHHATARHHAATHAKASHHQTHHTKAATHHSTASSHHSTTSDRSTTSHSTPTSHAHVVHQRTKGLSPKRRAALARVAAKGALGLYGIKDGVIAVDATGRNVTIGIPASKVCALAPDAGSRIVKSVRTGAPGIRHVSVVVAGTSGSLSSYRSAHCHTAAPPAGSGKLVLSQTGGGYQGTKKFKITGHRWTVSWANYGGFFSVNVEKNGKVSHDYLYSTAPGVGKKTFTDGPGTFQMIVDGPTWKVEVYDG